MTELISYDKGVCKAALDTPGLVIMITQDLFLLQDNYDRVQIFSLLPFTARIGLLRLIMSSFKPSITCTRTQSGQLSLNSCRSVEVCQPKGDTILHCS